MFYLSPFRRKRDLSPTEFGRELFRDFLYHDNWFDLSFKADIRENPTEYIVEAELPGFNKEQILVEFRNGTLTISVKQEEEVNEEKPNYVRQERRQGRIKRRFGVDNVNSEKITADYKDGLLIVTLPKLEEDEPDNFRIEIK